MIRANDLRVTIDGVKIVDGVTLTVQSGEWLSVIGPNGAGKSTLLRSLAGAVRSSGRLEIAGDDAAVAKRRHLARLVAWVPQTPVIPPGMRVVDYVLLGRTPHVNPLLGERPEDLDVMTAVLDDLDLGPLASRVVDTLSGGERQRVVIARALVQESPVLLLDEPTTALDLGHQQEVLALLDRLRTDGRTIITTMHDLTLAGQYADRLMLLAGGRVVAAGRPTEVLTTANLAQHYAADVRVQHDEDGAVVVLPARRPTRSGDPDAN